MDSTEAVAILTRVEFFIFYLLVQGCFGRGLEGGIILMLLGAPTFLPLDEDVLLLSFSLMSSSSLHQLKILRLRMTSYCSVFLMSAFISVRQIQYYDAKYSRQKRANKDKYQTVSHMLSFPCFFSFRISFRKFASFFVFVFVIFFLFSFLTIFLSCITSSVIQIWIGCCLWWWWWWNVCVRLIWLEVRWVKAPGCCQFCCH